MTKTQKIKSLFMHLILAYLTKAMDKNAKEYHIRALENEDFAPLSEMAEFQALIPPIESSIEDEGAKTEEELKPQHSNLNVFLDSKPKA